MLLVSAGVEAVENAVKIARGATKRGAVLCFDHGFHGRTLLGLSLTGKAVPYKAGLGPFAPEIYRLPFPYPYRGQGVQGSIEHALKTIVRPDDLAAIIVEPVPGGGRLPRLTRSVPSRAAGPGDSLRYRPHSGRGAERIRSYRIDVRVSDIGGDAGSDDRREVVCCRTAAGRGCRTCRPDGCNPARRSRWDVWREPAGLGGGAPGDPDHRRDFWQAATWIDWPCGCEAAR